MFRSRFCRPAFAGNISRQSSYKDTGVRMKGLSFWFVMLATAAVLAQEAPAGNSAQQKFISGGTIRLHLEAGGYTVTPSDSDKIVVTCHAGSEEKLRRVKLEIKTSTINADVYVSKTPHTNFQATIEVPRRSNLWARLSAGELDVEEVEGDKNLEVLSGRIQVDIPHPDEYGHRDASVTTGSIEASAFDVSKGGLFRSFEQPGLGKYRLHTHVITGEIDLRAGN
jgi:hypothetical protein